MHTEVDIAEHILRTGIQYQPHCSRILVQVEFQYLLGEPRVQEAARLRALDGVEFPFFPDCLVENGARP